MAPSRGASLALDRGLYLCLNPGALGSEGSAELQVVGVGGQPLAPGCAAGAVVAPGQGPRLVKLLARVELLNVVRAEARAGGSELCLTMGSLECAVRVVRQGAGGAWAPALSLSKTSAAVLNQRKWEESA